MPETNKSKFLDLTGLTIYNEGVINLINDASYKANDALNTHDISKKHLPTGGTTGFILKKNTNVDYDVSWVEDSITCANTINKSFLLGSDDQLKLNRKLNTNSECYMQDGGLYAKSLTTTGTITGSQVFNSVFNDIADSIEVNDDLNLIYGKCYCFDGDTYFPSKEYLGGSNMIVGIHSDTYGFNTGKKGKHKELDVAVAGFVLAYVDKEYSSGTPLTCTKDGYLTEITQEDKIKFPERIVGTFWKKELQETWGSKERQVKVNGRYWVKIK